MTKTETPAEEAAAPTIAEDRAHCEDMVRRSDEERYPLRNGYIKEHQKLSQPLVSAAEYYERYVGQDYACDVILEEALAFLENHRGEPFYGQDRLEMVERALRRPYR